MTIEKNKIIRVLFVCTGNACRSQMAEAWAKKLKPDQMEVYSAGTHPAGFVSQRVIKVMHEVGIDMSEYWSKPVEQWEEVDFNVVITLCDYAKEACPVFPTQTRLFHYPFPDPMAILGNEEATINAFRRARDMIKEFVDTLPEALETS